MAQSLIFELGQAVDSTYPNWLMVTLQARFGTPVRKVFDRWGMNVEQFCQARSDILAAHKVFSQDFFGPLKEDFFAPKRPPALERYLKAVKQGDEEAARRLRPDSGIEEHMRQAIEFSRKAMVAEAQPRRIRSSALDNPVLGVLLATPIENSPTGQTYGDYLRALLERGSAHEAALANPEEGAHDEGAPEGHRFFDLYLSSASKTTHSLGLLYRSSAPRSDEVCVLFEARKLAEVLDASNLQSTWRASIGPFVGIDAQMRLIVEQDLGWWRLENPELSD